MKSLLPLLMLLLAACGTVHPAEVHSCPLPPPAPLSPFQVIGEARTALFDSYDGMAKDEHAQARLAMADRVLRVHSDFLIGRDPEYNTLAPCAVEMLNGIIPDMAMFATRENAQKVVRARDMFSAIGGTCDYAVPSTAPVEPAEEDETVEGADESLDLTPSKGPSSI
jgi:hypothetical protein